MSWPPTVMKGLLVVDGSRRLLLVVDRSRRLLLVVVLFADLRQRPQILVPVKVVRPGVITAGSELAISLHFTWSSSSSLWWALQRQRRVVAVGTCNAWRRTGAYRMRHSRSSTGRQIQAVEAFDSTSSVNNSEGFFQL